MAKQIFKAINSKKKKKKARCSKYDTIENSHANGEVEI